jgi:hypothetical protein
MLYTLPRRRKLALHRTVLGCSVSPACTSAMSQSDNESQRPEFCDRGSASAASEESDLDKKFDTVFCDTYDVDDLFGCYGGIQDSKAKRNRDEPTSEARQPNGLDTPLVAASDSSIPGSSAQDDAAAPPPVAPASVPSVTKLASPAQTLARPSLALPAVPRTSRLTDLLFVGLARCQDSSGWSNLRVVARRPSACVRGDEI